MEEFGPPAGSGCCCLICVRQNEVGVVEDLGQFKKLLSPGLHCLCWPFQQVAGRLSLRIKQLDVVCETKTKDNVFVQVAVAVQYNVLAESAYDAYYRLTDPRGQIQSYVFDVVRSTVPKMELDEAFASKDEIATAVLRQLQDVMRGYGYAIRNTLVTGTYVVVLLLLLLCVCVCVPLLRYTVYYGCIVVAFCRDEAHSHSLTHSHLYHHQNIALICTTHTHTNRIRPCPGLPRQGQYE